MQTTLRIRGHDDDVNAVVFLDDSSNLIASGSDDTLIKVGPPSDFQHRESYCWPEIHCKITVHPR